MQSRMDKYQETDDKALHRTSKNTKLYDDVYDDMYHDTSYKNMSIIDSAKEININKLKDIIDDKYDTRQYRTLKNYSIEDVNVDDKPSFNEERDKIYDINEIINAAKNKRTFIEEAKEKQKYLDYTKGRVNKSEEQYEKMKEEESELEDLINTMAIPKDEIDKADSNDALDMLNLRGDDNTIVTNPIETNLDEDEKNETKEVKDDTSINTIGKDLKKADRTFYTDSNMFTKNDFEDFGTLSKEMNSGKKKKKIVVILIALIIIAILGYFVITKLVLKK